MGKGNHRHVSGNRLILHVLLEPFGGRDSFLTINVALFQNCRGAVDQVITHSKKIITLFWISFKSKYDVQSGRSLLRIANVCSASSRRHRIQQSFKIITKILNAFVGFTVKRQIKGILLAQFSKHAAIIKFEISMCAVAASVGNNYSWQTQ